MKKFIIVSLLIVCGCDIPESTHKLNSKIDQRFSVDVVAVFDDPLAYKSTRAVYVLKDKETNKEYIGISGVGISEVSTDGENTIER